MSKMFLSDKQTDENVIYRSYRQGGMRYENVVDPDKPPLELHFEENIYISAASIWDKLFPGARFSPLEMASVFENQHPVNVEIGIGNGEFITHYAAQNPNENWLGFEVYHKVFYKAVSRIRKSNLSNIRIVQFDVELFVRLLPEKSVQTFFVNFPDPWPKLKHTKRRLLKPWFINLMRTRLTEGGSIIVTTDHDDYAAEITQNFAAVKGLVSAFDAPYKKDLGDYYKTKYYRKFAESKTVYFYHYKKV